MKKLFDVAVVEATGLKGRSILNMLEKRDFPVANPVLFSTGADTDLRLDFKGKKYPVLPLNGENVIKNRTDVAFFCCTGAVSKKFAPLFSALSTAVIDTSPAFRKDENVPLVVPSVNPSSALMSDGIIATADCLSAVAAEAMQKLHKKYGIKRIVYSTYQPLSTLKQMGATEDISAASIFGKKIKNNIVPQIGEILASGYSEEEQMLIDETRKILGDESLSVTATSVLVPAIFGSSISVNVELNYSVSPSDIERTFIESGLELSACPTPLDTEGKSEIFAGRIRRDFSHPNTFNFFLTFDNIQKTALNVVQLAELLI